VASSYHGHWIIAELKLLLLRLLLLPVKNCLPTVAGTWTKVNTGTYLGTIGFAYLSFVMFILFFFGLVLFQSAVNEELGLRELLSAASLSAVAAAMAWSAAG
jgi:hypothetical protein